MNTMGTYYTKVTPDTDKVYTGADADIVTDAVDEDVVIVYVDLDDASNAGEEVGLDEFSAGTGYANAVVVYDDDGTIIAIFVETSGEVDLSTVVKLPSSSTGTVDDKEDSEDETETAPSTGNDETTGNGEGSDTSSTNPNENDSGNNG